MKNLLYICFAATCLLPADVTNFLKPNKQETYEVILHNRPLVKIHGKTFSVMDVRKKMDLFLHEHQPETFASNLLLYQFYAQNWRPVLQEMIDNELMKMEAEDFKVQISDGDIREEMDKRFGPNVSAKIDELGISYDDAKELVRDDIILRNMSWFRIWAKTMQKVTPELIKSECDIQLTKLTPSDEWVYKMASVRGDNETGLIAQKAYELLLNAGVTSLDQSNVLKINESIPSPAILNLSEPITVASKDLAPEILKVLENLPFETFSQPIAQKSRIDGSTVYRMFYVIGHEKASPIPFEELSARVRNILMERYGEEQKQEYFAKLRKRYLHEELVVKSMFPANYQPFTLCVT